MNTITLLITPAQQVPVVLFAIEIFMFLFEWGSWDSLHKVTLGPNKECL